VEELEWPCGRQALRRLRTAPIGIKLFLPLYVIIVAVCRVTGPPGTTMSLKELLGLEKIKASGESKGSWKSSPNPLASYHLRTRESKGRLFSFA